MTLKQEKEYWQRYRRLMGRRQESRSGRYFLDQENLGEFRWNEAIEFSRAKREGRKIVGSYLWAPSCGCCFIALGKSDTDAALPSKQQKGTPTKRSKLSKQRGYIPPDRTIYKRDSILY